MFCVLILFSFSTGYDNCKYA